MLLNLLLAEFKAWFEGFTESIDGAPNEKQFERIKAKVDSITGTPIAPVVIREYYDRYRSYWSTPAVPYYIPNGAVTTGGVIVGSPSSGQSVNGYSAESALYDLGKAEYRVANEGRMV